MTSFHITKQTKNVLFCITTEKRVCNNTMKSTLGINEVRRINILFQLFKLQIGKNLGIRDTQL